MRGIEKDHTLCPKCGRMYCEGFWGEGVCTADMHFCGEPTADGDAAAGYLRAWYEANRESWWDRCSANRLGRAWEWACDEFMLGLMAEVRRINNECERQLAALKTN